MKSASWLDGCWRRGRSCRPGMLRAHEHPLQRSQADPTFQFVFFSALDGCFQDGLSDQDVDQILKKDPGRPVRAFYLFLPGLHGDDPRAGRPTAPVRTPACSRSAADCRSAKG